MCAPAALANNGGGAFDDGSDLGGGGGSDGRPATGGALVVEHGLDRRLAPRRPLAAQVHRRLARIAVLRRQHRRQKPAINTH